MSTKGRGRKPGGGVLKEIEAGQSALTVAGKLAYGRAAGDHYAEMVRTWRAIYRACEDLAARENKLLVCVAGEMPTLQTLNIPPEHQPRNKEQEDAIARYLSSEQDKWRTRAHEKLKDIETRHENSPEAEREAFLKDGTNLKVVRYLEDKGDVDSWLRDEMTKLTLLVRANMQFGKSAWFRRVADAIDAEITADGQDTYPLHAALFKLGQLRCTTNEQGLRCYTVGAPLDQTPRYTIAEVCRILEDLGHRPDGQSDENWQRSVRRACHEVDLRLLPGKPGRPRKA